MTHPLRRWFESRRRAFNVKAVLWVHPKRTDGLFELHAFVTENGTDWFEVGELATIQCAGA